MSEYVLESGRIMAFSLPPPVSHSVYQFLSSFILLLPSVLPPREKGEAQSNWIPPNSEGNVDST